jgi:hypothetical protein
MMAMSWSAWIRIVLAVILVIAALVLFRLHVAAAAVTFAYDSPPCSAPPELPLVEISEFRSKNSRFTFLISGSGKNYDRETCLQKMPLDQRVVDSCSRNSRDSLRFACGR